jgi:peptide/nickel transport system substrate-binding protein
MIVGWRRGRAEMLQWGLAASLMLTACGPGATAISERGNVQAQPAAAPKRVVAAVLADPPTLRNTINTRGASGSVPGVDTLEGLLNAGLVASDHHEVLHARLAETIPSIENGLWKVFPDGTMETTWKIRPTARWHDGTPFTADDLAFTAAVANDQDLGVFREAVFDLVAGIDSVDERTAVVRWKQPFIAADALFGTSTDTAPLPRHLLARPLLEDKAGFTLLPYWGPEYVGSGPFQIREFTRGSHIILQAFDGYALGRPKLDEIEVRFIPDAGTLIANVLAGSVELTLGRNISLDESLNLREQYRGGRVEVGPANWIAVYPQFLSPTPAVVGNLQFRRALMHAIDREGMVDTLQAGLGGVAHSILIPDEPDFRGVEQRAVRYDYDPRRANQLIGELGYTKGPDGEFRDANGERLTVEIRTTQMTDQQKPMFAIADYWKTIGLATQPVVVTPQQARDRDFRANYPAFELAGQPSGTDALQRVRISEIPLAANNLVGVNRARYYNQQLDDLIERFFATIPKRERADVLGQIVNHMTSQLVWMSIYHRVEPALMANRIAKVYPRPQGGSSSQAWNAHEWDVGG